MTFEEEYDEFYEKLNMALFTKYKNRRTDICKFFTDKNIDLNQHRDLIASIAVFAVTETDAYWHRQETKDEKELSKR